MPAHIAIGNDSFQKMRALGVEYVDKTRLIQELLDDLGTEVLLLPRPRRFGKTLTMSMLEAYFALREEDFSPLFEGLHIWSAGDQYRAHFQRYPTVFITFKNLKAESIEQWNRDIRLELSKLFERHTAILPRLNSREQKEYRQLLDKEADLSLLGRSLSLLTEWLERAHGEKVLILIDEYDTPIQTAWLATNDLGQSAEALRASLYGQVTSFFRTFFGSALKGNASLFKAVMTGILRVSKESMFSDLNNLLVCTMLDRPFSDSIGFTETEVVELFARQEQSHRLQEARRWYNGYQFGPHTIYNPWSVLNYLKNPHALPQPYWLNTSANELVKRLLQKQAFLIGEDLQELMRGGSIERAVDSNISFVDMERSPDAALSLLFFAGYLKGVIPENPPSSRHVRLSIPNVELNEIYTGTFKYWLEQRFEGSSDRVRQLVTAMLNGDLERFERLLEQYCQNIISIHDMGRDPEAFYQGLMLGLCAVLEPSHRVLSNRETGYGRADLLIVPRTPGQSGAVLELKVARKKYRTMKQALAEGRAQLDAKNYVAELTSAGATPIHKWVLAFDGKQVKVQFEGKE